MYFLFFLLLDSVNKGRANGCVPNIFAGQCTFITRLMFFLGGDLVLKQSVSMPCSFCNITKSLKTVDHFTGTD